MQEELRRSESQQFQMKTFTTKSSFLHETKWTRPDASHRTPPQTIVSTPRTCLKRSTLWRCPYPRLSGAIRRAATKSYTIKTEIVLENTADQEPLGIDLDLMFNTWYWLTCFGVTNTLFILISLKRTQYYYYGEKSVWKSILTSALWFKKKLVGNSNLIGL